MMINSGKMVFSEGAYARISRPYQNLQGASLEVDGGRIRVSALDLNYTGHSEFSNSVMVAIENLGELVDNEPFVNYPAGQIYLGGHVRAGYFIVEDGGEFRNDGSMHAEACIIQRELATYAPSTITGSRPVSTCAQNVWAGGHGSNWSTVQNWKTFGLPDPGESIEVRNTGEDVHLDVPFTLSGQARLTIAQEATLIVDGAGRQLTVGDGIVENSGRLAITGGAELRVQGQGVLKNFCVTDIYSSTPGVTNQGLIENFGRMTNHFTGDFLNDGGTLRNSSPLAASDRLCSFISIGNSGSYLANLGALRLLNGATFHNDRGTFYNAWNSSEGTGLPLPQAFAPGEDWPGWPRQRPLLEIKASTLTHDGGTFINEGFIDGLCETCVDTRIENNGTLQNHGLIGIGGSPAATLSGRESEFVNEGTLWNEGSIYVGFYFPPEAVVEPPKADFQGYARFINRRSIINGCLRPPAVGDPCGFVPPEKRIVAVPPPPYIELGLRSVDFVNEGTIENRSTGTLVYYPGGASLKEEGGTFENFQPVFNQEPAPGTVKCHVQQGDLRTSEDDFVGTYTEAFSGLLNIRRACDPATSDLAKASDEDGLLDVDETNVYGTDPDNPDTDGDSISDLLEVRGLATPGSEPNPFYESNPLVPDTDGDSLTDDVERQGWFISTSMGSLWVNSSPNKVDTDGDGLSDSEEKNASTHPAFADIDRDGLNDAAELAAGSDPFAASEASFALSVSRLGEGGGRVTSDPAGIICGSACEQGYAAGTGVTLNARLRRDSLFGGWTGCDTTQGTRCTLALNEARAVTATFNPRPTVASAMPAITNPKPGSVLPGPSADFAWTPNQKPVRGWRFFAGSREGARDLFDSGVVRAQVQEARVKGLPVDGRKLFVRLWFTTGIGWQFADYVYTAARLGTTRPPILVQPERTRVPTERIPVPAERIPVPPEPEPAPPRVPEMSPEPRLERATVPPEEAGAREAPLKPPPVAVQESVREVVREAPLEPPAPGVQRVPVRTPTTEVQQAPVRQPASAVQRVPVGTPSLRVLPGRTPQLIRTRSADSDQLPPFPQIDAELDAQPDEGPEAGPKP